MLIDTTLALRAARALTDAAGVDLVLPGDPRREAVVLALGALHKLSGRGWNVDHARESVCVTVPPIGPALDLLGLVPVVGEVFRALAGTQRRTTIYLSPSLMGEGRGGTVMGVVQHELGHAGDIARGGLAWCLAYGLVPEVTMGAEAPCMACDAAHMVAFDGLDADAACADREATLRAYVGDDEAALRLGRGLLEQVRASLRLGVDPTGTVRESLAALAAVGMEL